MESRFFPFPKNQFCLHDPLCCSVQGYSRDRARAILLIFPGAYTIRDTMKTLDLWKVKDVPLWHRLCNQFCNLTLQHPGLNLSNNNHNYKPCHLGLGMERKRRGRENRVRTAEQLLVDCMVRKWLYPFVLFLGKCAYSRLRF